MTMKNVVQRFCLRTGIPRPETVYGSTDNQVKQIMGLLEEEGAELATRHPWEGITFEASHTSLAVEDQGAVTSIATNAYSRLKDETIWSRTTGQPICGPMDSKDWQASKAVASTGPRYRYRIRGGHLLVNPVPTAGESWYFEYVSENWILDVDGVTYKQFFTADTDTLLLPEKIVLMGLRWRWKKEKGLEYAEDMESYERVVKDLGGSDGSKKTLHMDCHEEDARPGVLVPEGSWALP